MSEYNKKLGANLRKARLQTGWSLQMVSKQTEEEFKASVVGAYERGERAITVERFHRLCGFYGVHPVAVIPVL